MNKLNVFEAMFMIYALGFTLEKVAAMQEHGIKGTSISATTPATTPPVADVKPVKKGPQLIGDLPIANEEALQTFTQIPENHYQYSTLGRSREALESMTCDCQYEHG